jgi:5'-nucleotidase
MRYIGKSDMDQSIHMFLIKRSWRCRARRTISLPLERSVRDPMTLASKTLKILLTNDDGIYAPGLWALYEHLKRDHQLMVVAPDRERSAVGHGITLHQPLRAAHIELNGFRGWAVSGTPADCVKLAIRELLPAPPDMVVSGINPGANVGINLNYSGTVAAAKEAAIYGFPALAISIQGGDDPLFETAARCIAQLIPLVHDQRLPAGTFLNVNVPNLPWSSIAGMRLSRQCIDPYDDYFEKRHDPRNRVYYWQGGEPRPAFRHPDADDAVLTTNCISITPVRCDMTDYLTLEKLRKWDLRPGDGSSQPGGLEETG